MRTKLKYLLSIIFLYFVTSTHSFAEILITQQESKLLPAVNQNTTRGISRGPSVVIVSPNPTQGHIKSPFDLKIQFEGRGGNKIDVSQIKVTYLKSPEVDLTDRLKNSITEKGIEFSHAEVPVGEHVIKILVKDKDGRETSSVLNFFVEK
jgi:hypothetical protein